MTKKILSLIFLTGFLAKAEAQSWSIGPKINLGIGWISSHNLKDNLNSQRLADNQIEKWDQTVTPGVNFGLGISVGYNFNEHATLMGELSWNMMNSKMIFDYTRDNAQSGNGNITYIHSESLIRTQYVSLPVLLKYSFSGESGFYGIGGFQFAFFGNPVIESNEARTKDTYKNGMITGTSIENTGGLASLDVFTTTRISLTLGLGYSFKAGSKSVLMDLRYQLPFTQSTMYTTDPVYADHTFDNNAVFTQAGKSKYESNSPSFPLNDFKLSTIAFSIALILFNK